MTGPPCLTRPNQDCRSAASCRYPYQASAVPVVLRCLRGPLNELMAVSSPQFVGSRPTVRMTQNRTAERRPLTPAFAFARVRDFCRAVNAVFKRFRSVLCLCCNFGANDKKKKIYRVNKNSRAPWQNRVKPPSFNTKSIEICTLALQDASTVNKSLCTWLFVCKHRIRYQTYLAYSAFRH